MKKTIAGPDGSIDVDLSPEEEASLKSDWEKSDAAQKEYREKKEYLNLRKLAYPSIQDQFLMLWSSMDSGEIPKSKAFYEAIKAVNDKYPQPSVSPVSP